MADHHPTSEETLRRVREIIRQAAIQGGEAWQRLQQGSLTDEPAPGDDMLQLFAAGAQPATGKRAAEVEAKQVQREAERHARADAEAAEEAEAKAQRLRREADDLKASAQRAEQRAREAEAEARRARSAAEQSGRRRAR
jgi:membrane protein involved in colicin uptake